LVVQTFVGSMLANWITIALLYGIWRLTKNEQDMKAIGICLACLGVTALFALGAHQ
jgi:hypothetical protein